MLNAKYSIVPHKENGTQAVKNEDALGSAWLVNKYKIVEDANAEIEALNFFDPKTEAIVDKKFSNQIESFNMKTDSSAYIKLISYAPNHLVYETYAKTPQLAVFSEIYYKDGWQASVDGIKSNHFRANYILRGMMIPEGKRVVEFNFQPQDFYSTEKLSVGSMIVFFILAIVGIIFGVKTQCKNSNKENE